MGRAPLPERILIPAIAALGAAAFLAALVQPDGRFALPLDDAWIHLAYARNLAEHGRWALTPEAPITSGTTGYLWGGLLALLLGAGVPPGAAAAIPGALLFVACVIAWQRLLAANGEPRTLMALAALAVALSGNLLFLAVSGMETLAGVFLALLGVERHAAGDRRGAGAACAALALLRPEGVLLGLVLSASAGLEGLRRGGLGTAMRAAASALIPAILGFGAMLALNFATGGEAMPSTLAGRRLLIGLSPAMSVSASDLAADLPKLLLEWGAWARDFDYTLGYGGLFAGESGTLHGLASAVDAHSAGASILLAALGLVWLASPAARPLMPLLAFTLLVDLAYAVVLPALGHAGRYQPLNLVWIPALPAFGAALVTAISRNRWPHRRTTEIAGLMTGLLLFLAVGRIGNAVAWRLRTARAAEHIQSVHVAAAEWAATELPAGSRLAASDIGALAYYSERTLVDYSGLTDREGMRALHDRRILNFLRLRGATHLVFMLHHGGDLPFARAEMGLYPRPAGSYRLPGFRPLATFEIAASGWEHFGWTRNALPRLRIYELRW